MTVSVIVVIVDGGAQLERCLRALAAQAEAPPLEVLVPWDDSVPESGALAARYPAVRFLPLGTLPTRHHPGSPAGLHELFDQRRTAGLLAATGAIVALLEDRSVPAPPWARRAVQAHAERPNGAIGGALADGRTGWLGRADYLCDFYRFQPPQAPGPRDYLSYVNITYKRAALERTRDRWRDGYYDLAVHRALQDAGDPLWLDPDLLVQQMRGDGTRLTVLLAERFAWGRRYAARRLQSDPAARWRFLLRAPLVPAVLWLRALGAQRGGAARAGALAASPIMLLIYGAWGLGELAGYLTGES